MTIKVVGALPEPYYRTLPEPSEPRSDGSKRSTKSDATNPNRYTYRIGVVQQIIRELVKTPNQWSLVREASKNRSTLAPTLQKYKQIRFATRKRNDGLFDIYAMYTPDENGQPDEVLADALAEWSEREKKALAFEATKREKARI